MNRVSSTLLEGLLEAAKASELTNHGISFIDGMENKKITYKELLEQAKQTASALENYGVKKGHYVILQLKEPESFIKIFWGCIVCGAVPIPLSVIEDKGLQIDKLKNVMAVLKQYVIITDNEMKEILSQKLNIECGIYAMEDLAVSTYTTMDIIIQPSDLAYIQFSSGSTAEPKGVCLTHHNICSNIEGMINRFKEGNQIEYQIEYERIVGWLPLSHNMGLIGTHLLPLLAGAQQYLLTPQHLIQNTISVLEKIKEENITIMTCPTFLMKWLMMRIKEEEMQLLDFTSIHTILMGAEPISPQLVRNFESKFSAMGLRNNTICCGFGMAETSLIVSLQGRGEGLEVEEVDGEEVVLNGSVLDGVEIYVVDRQGNKLAEGETGEIVIKSSSVMQGYIGVDSSNVLKEGHLYTGDIGTILKGRVVILGRKKDLLIINAKNYYASDIEIKIEQIVKVPSEYFAIVSTLDENKVEIIELFIQEELYLKQPQVGEIIEKAFEMYTGGAIAHSFVIKTMPKTVSGKKQRYQLPMIKNKRQIIQRQIKQDAEEVQCFTPLEALVGDIWKEVLCIAEVDLHTSFFKFGGNSLSIIECISKLKKYNLYITQEYFFSHPTVSEIAKKLEEGGETIKAIQDIIVGEVIPLPNRYRAIKNPVINQWNFSSMLEFNPMPTKEQLSQVIKQLLIQHDGLRHHIINNGNKVFEQVAEVDSSLCIEWIMCNDLKDEIEALADHYQGTLDIATCPFKIVAITSPNKKGGKILFLCHHVLVDAYSIKIFMEDFINIYKTIVIKQKKYKIGEKTTSLKEWGEVVNQFALSEQCQEDASYWRNICSKHNHIPYDYEWGQEDNYMIFEKEHIFDITKVGQKIDVEELDLKLMGAWAQTVKEWSQQENVLLQYTLNGRHGIGMKLGIDLSRTIGWMAFLVPIEIDLRSIRNKEETLESVKKAIHSIPHGGISYDCLKYVVEDSVINQSVMPEVTFNYYDVNTQTLLYDDGVNQIKIAQENLGALEHPRKVRDRVLDLVVRRTETGKLYAKIHYSSRIHSLFTIKKITQIFKKNVDEMLAIKEKDLKQYKHTNKVIKKIT